MVSWELREENVSSGQKPLPGQGRGQAEMDRAEHGAAAGGEEGQEEVEQEFSLRWEEGGASQHHS